MQDLSKEWLEFLRGQFPAGSRIQTWELDDPRNTLEEAGKLDHIDDEGRFHIRQSDGGERTLTLGEDFFSVHPPEPQMLKSAFGRRIFQQDLIHVYEQKTEYRDTLSRDAERAMGSLIAQMEQSQLQNENLERLVMELAERLQNTKGKKVYGYLPPKTKALVDAIVDELAKEERVAAAYDLWNQMREEVCRTYSEQLPERLPLSQQKEFKAVRNMVIREVLQMEQGEHPTVDEVVHMPTPPSTPSMQSGAPPGAHDPQRKATSHQHAQTQRAVSHADAARCVLHLFHNMGRIFQEQSATDTIQTGLHIDKKRRRMLREKRMALGHKADDHEEIPQHSQR